MDYPFNVISDKIILTTAKFYSLQFVVIWNRLNYFSFVRFKFPIKKKVASIKVVQFRITSSTNYEKCRGFSV